MSQIYSNDNNFNAIDSELNQFLTFSIAKESYGIEIKYIQEIVGIQKISEIPDAPPYIKGVINLRNQVFPVIDLRLKFNMDFKEYDGRTCIIIINYNEALFGLIVDIVNEVIDIPHENIDYHAKSGIKNLNKFIKGIGKIKGDIKILIDIAEIVNSDNIIELNSN